MAVVVTGLNEIIRAFRQIDQGMSKELRKQLRVGVGGPIVADMKQEARTRGLRKTGRLIGGLRPAVRGADLFVNESARNKGYPYPAVFEFGKGGVRSFMQPVVDKWASSGLLEEHMVGYLEWIEKEFRA